MVKYGPFVECGSSEESGNNRNVTKQLASWSEFNVVVTTFQKDGSAGDDGDRNDMSKTTRSESGTDLAVQGILFATAWKYVKPRTTEVTLADKNYTGPGLFVDSNNE